MHNVDLQALSHIAEVGSGKRNLLTFHSALPPLVSIAPTSVNSRKDLYYTL